MASLWEASPWWHNEDEICDSMPLIIPDSFPIKYPEIWDREREIYAYNPRFLPNTVTFDLNNRPVIRVGVHDVVGNHATVYFSHRFKSQAYIQTLNNDRQWIALPLNKVMEESVAGWNNDLIYSGTFQAEERVVFDKDNDAYTIVITKRHGNFLLHSRDDMESWNVYALGVHGSFRLEMTASDRPPVISVSIRVLNKDNKLSIIAPQKKSDGTLDNLDAIDLVPERTSTGPSHSGVGDHTVTIDNLTHAVYIDTSANHTFTSQFD